MRIYSDSNNSVKKEEQLEIPCQYSTEPTDLNSRMTVLGDLTNLKAINSVKFRKNLKKRKRVNMAFVDKENISYD